MVLFLFGAEVAPHLFGWKSVPSGRKERPFRTPTPAGGPHPIMRHLTDRKLRKREKEEIRKSVLGKLTTVSVTLGAFLALQIVGALGN